MLRATSRHRVHPYPQPEPLPARLIGSYPRPADDPGRTEVAWCRSLQRIAGRLLPISLTHLSNRRMLAVCKQLRARQRPGDEHLHSTTC